MKTDNSGMNLLLTILVYAVAFIVRYFKNIKY